MIIIASLFTLAGAGLVGMAAACGTVVFSRDSTAGERLFLGGAGLIVGSAGLGAAWIGISSIITAAQG